MENIFFINIALSQTYPKHFFNLVHIHFINTLIIIYEKIDFGSFSFSFSFEL